MTTQKDSLRLRFILVATLLSILCTIAIWPGSAHSQNRNDCVFYQTLLNCLDSVKDGIYQPGMEISAGPLPAVPFFAVGRDYSSNELEALSFSLRNEDSTERYYGSISVSPDLQRITSDSKIFITEKTKEQLKVTYDRNLAVHFGDFRPVEETLDGKNIQVFWENWAQENYRNDCVVDCPIVIESSEEKAEPWKISTLQDKYGGFKGGISYCREQRSASGSWPPQNCAQVIRYHKNAVLIRTAIETWRPHESVPRYGDIDFKCSIGSDDLVKKVGETGMIMKRSPYLLRANQRQLTEYVFKIVGLRRFENSMLFQGYRELTSVDALIFSSSSKNQFLDVEVTIGLHLTKLNSTKYIDYKIADAGHRVIYTKSLMQDFQDSLDCGVTWSR